MSRGNSGFFGSRVSVDVKTEEELNVQKSRFSLIVIVGIVIAVIVAAKFGTNIFSKDDPEDYKKLNIIKYDTQGGEPLEDSVGIAGDEIELPVAVKEGYIFEYWVDSKEKKVESPYKIKKDTTLYARYRISDINYYTVTFVVDGVTYTEKKVTEGAAVDSIGEIVKEGYNFNGWYEGSRKYDFNRSVYSNITLTAKYTPDYDYLFTVRFSDNYVNEPYVVEVKFGKTVKQPKDPSRDGYIFKGWYLDGQKYDFSTPVKKSMLLSAYWEKETEEMITFILIKYDVNKGDYEIAPVLHEKGKTLVEPTTPTRKGYEFVGWYYEGKKWDFRTPVTKEMTLVAKWKAVE